MYKPSVIIAHTIMIRETLKKDPFDLVVRYRQLRITFLVKCPFFLSSIPACLLTVLEEAFTHPVFTCNMGSISPTFYKQLLRAKIPNAQKDSRVISVFLSCKMFMKLTPGVFYTCSFQKRKKILTT